MKEREKIIQTMVERIVERFHPLRVILFGSHARGAAVEDSEVRRQLLLPKNDNYFYRLDRGPGGHPWWGFRGQRPLGGGKLVFNGSKIPGHCPGRLSKETSDRRTHILGGRRNRRGAPCKGRVTASSWLRPRR